MKRLILIICVLTLTVPGLALAQTSGDEGYGGSGGVNRQIGSGDKAQEPSDDGGGLPFSGSDLIVLGSVGAAMLLMGFTLRRMTHDRRPRQHRRA